MNGKDFITMMRQDIETHTNKAQLSTVIDVMEAVVSMNPKAEINSEGKTPEDCYKKMYDYANRHKRGNSYFFDTKQSIKIVSDYLGIVVNAGSTEKTVQPENKINLEDFL